MEPPMNADERRSNHLGDGEEPVADPVACERFVRLCRMTDEMLAKMTPAERDRMMQEHLAAARGPERNLELLCNMTETLLALRKQTQTKGDSDGS